MNLGRIGVTGQEKHVRTFSNDEEEKSGIELGGEGAEVLNLQERSE